MHSLSQSLFLRLCNTRSDLCRGSPLEGAAGEDGHVLGLCKQQEAIGHREG
jgi:hypothetical protein